MKKYILILLLFPFISNAQWSIQNYQFNVTDSGSVGIGIKAPTSKVHVFGNGTASNLFNITNDKDATKDSSVVIDAIGNVGIGKTPSVDIKLDVDGFVNIDSSLTVDQNISLSGLLSEIRFNRGGNISAPGFNCKFTGMGVDIDTAQYFAIHYNRVLSSDNDTTISLGNFHLNLDNYTGKVGIGISAPTYRLDVFGNGGADNLLKVSNDINSTYDSTFVVNKIGKVGIGTTTPTAKLHIDGNKITPDDLVYVTNDKDATKDSTFIINSNGFVAIGSNTAYHPLHVWGSANGGANIYSEYSGSSISSAIKGYATGSAGFGIIGDASTIGTAGGFFQNTASGIALDLKSDNGIALRIRSGDIVVDSTRLHSPSTTLSDDEAYSFPTNLSWKGEIDVDSLGYTLFTAQIRCDANGTPYLEGVSWKRWSSITYVEVGSTGGYLNITDGGSGMVITNTLGYTIKATLRFRTKQ